MCGNYKHPIEQAIIELVDIWIDGSTQNSCLILEGENDAIAYTFRASSRILGYLTADAETSIIHRASEKKVMRHNTSAGVYFLNLRV